jgi:transposase-like protein
VRLQIAQAVVDRGTSAATVSQAFGIPVSTVMDWATRYRRSGSDPKRFATEPRPRKETAARREPDPRREAVVAAVGSLEARLAAVGADVSTVPVVDLPGILGLVVATEADIRSRGRGGG